MIPLKYIDILICVFTSIFVFIGLIVSIYIFIIVYLSNYTSAPVHVSTIFLPWLDRAAVALPGNDRNLGPLVVIKIICCGACGACGAAGEDLGTWGPESEPNVFQPAKKKKQTMHAQMESAYKLHMENKTCSYPNHNLAVRWRRLPWKIVAENHRRPCGAPAWRPSHVAPTLGACGSLHAAQAQNLKLSIRNPCHLHARTLKNLQNNKGLQEAWNWKRMMLQLHQLSWSNWNPPVSMRAIVCPCEA